MEQISVKVSIQAPKPYLDLSIDSRFQGVDRLFLLSFKNNGDRKVNTKYYLPTVEIKVYNVMIDDQNSFSQPVKNNLTTYDNYCYHFIVIIVSII